MKFLSILVLGNARTVGLYTAQYEQLFEMPVKKESKRVVRVKAPVNDIIDLGKNEALNDKPKRPQINYFAGPHSVFNPGIKY